MEIFFEIHHDNPREGPGDFESTKRAFSLMENLPDKSRILDIGCGPGKQTIDLSRICQGKIIAIDNHQPYVDRLKDTIASYKLEDRIQVRNKDMFNLDFAPNYFDVIWSEGAIYNIGFEKGLTSWKQFLKKNGYIAVTEISCLKNNPPEEIQNYWYAEYPDMQSIESNVEIIIKCGFKIIDYFVLPEKSWWENYYNPIKKRISNLKLKYSENEDATRILELEEKEMEMYKKYSDYYGYVFYIMQSN